MSTPADCHPINRAVRKFQKKGIAVAKLVREPQFCPLRIGKHDGTDKGGYWQFAKHFKIEEQALFLKKSRTGIAVGTPQRLIDLIENGMLHSPSPVRDDPPLLTLVPDALSLENLRRLVVDASHIDLKKRGIMDMRETVMPLARLLSMPELKARYTDTERHVDLIFY